MKLSNRTNLVEASVTLGITQKAKELSKQGINVIPFSAGELSFNTPQSIIDAGIKSLQNGRHHYSPAAGIPELRAAVADKYAGEFKLSYSAENVLISCGAKGALSTLFLTLFETGDEILILSPYWVSYPKLAQIAGAIPISVPLDSDGQIEKETLQKYITSRTTAIIYSSPSNPTGLCLNKESFQAIAQVAIENKLWIISDEIYEGLSDTSHKSILSFCPEIEDQAIIINGFSKRFAMTGWRIGYLIGPTKLVQAATRIQGHCLTNTATHIQDAALFALINVIPEMEQFRKEISKRRNLTYQLLTDIPNIKVAKPEGSLYIFPDVSAYYKANHRPTSHMPPKSYEISGSIDFASFLIKEAKIAVVPGEPFGNDQCIRISYALDEKQIIEGLSRMKEILQKLDV